MKKKLISITVLFLLFLSGCSQIEEVNEELDLSGIVTNKDEALQTNEEKEELLRIRENRDNPDVVNEVKQRNQKEVKLYEETVKKWDKASEFAGIMKEYMDVHKKERLYEQKEKKKYERTEVEEDLIDEFIKVYYEMEEMGIGSHADFVKLQEDVDQLNKNKELLLVLYSQQEMNNMKESVSIMVALFEWKIALSDGIVISLGSAETDHAESQLARIEQLHKETQSFKQK